MSDRFNLTELLHPSQAFAHPSAVVHDPDLTLNEKRAILASWASDACALEAAPEFREIPGGTRIRFDDIMDALRELDEQSQGEERVPAYRRLVRKRRLGGILRSRRPDQSQPLQ